MFFNVFQLLSLNQPCHCHHHRPDILFSEKHFWPSLTLSNQKEMKTATQCSYTLHRHMVVIKNVDSGLGLPGLNLGSATFFVAFSKFINLSVPLEDGDQKGFIWSSKLSQGV
ncbi:uncharacterized protein LOC120889140 [Ictidomys tridecemlineatus]